MIIDARKFLANNYTTGECAVCGGAVEPDAIGIKKAVSNTFTDWQALIQGTGRKCCHKCAEIIKERQCRSKCVFSQQPGSLEFFKYSAVYDVLCNPPEKFVLSVPQSFKKHHWLYAGISTPERMAIGTDTGTIIYEPAKHGKVLLCIKALLDYGVPSSQIETGLYHPSEICGALNFTDLENVISPHRATGLIWLLVKITPKEKIQCKEVEVVRTTAQSNAASYLLQLALCSNSRIKSGLLFWGGFFEARINRVKGLDFDKATSKLMTSLQCRPSTFIAAMVDEMSDKSKEEIMKTIREQTKLCVSLAYYDLKKRRWDEIEN